MLFTVDEVDPTLDEMVQLAAFYQHFVREGRKVALLMAGLPHNISSLLNNKTVSFLRRSNRRALEPFPTARFPQRSCARPKQATATLTQRR